MLRNLAKNFHSNHDENITIYIYQHYLIINALKITILLSIITRMTRLLSHFPFLFTECPNFTDILDIPMFRKPSGSDDSNHI